ncbi:uncharacterized protein PADG_11861 [Paracoccidioides brasiliensis Pb18]|uniref:Uncharacterized protein n=1 Tax=Paracoccidioides brasiliensis (strain Pb18) TaxID=502780 RepID=A0A0A0HVJ9_PARBD|nr:uncharacterized protein PADG_11861 [Paracoccidioides brasiliensis Pb18]KGM92066.1 hypothetical protein PADG_11861 [Paracoccidioides brasiliensis Pb18]
MGAGRKLETGGSPVKQTVGQQNHPQQCAEQLLFCSLLLCSRVPGKGKKEEEEEEEESGTELYTPRVLTISGWKGSKKRCLPRFHAIYEFQSPTQPNIIIIIINNIIIIIIIIINSNNNNNRVLKIAGFDVEELPGTCTRDQVLAGATPEPSWDSRPVPGT